MGEISGCPPKFSHSHLLLSFSLLFFSLFNLSLSQDLEELCHPHDKRVLLRIKAHLGNPSSLGSWAPNQDCCAHWNDIRCNDQGHVTMVRINEAHDIRSPIPPLLDDLPSLTSFYFEDIPNLSGPIPSYIGKLTNLTGLVISGTNVGGPIPSFLGRLTKLTLLELSSNKHTGPIPNFLGQFKRLTWLDLSSNLLTGPIPPPLAQLTLIDYLRLSSNQLSGPIPDFLDQRYKNLITIDFDSNHLSGPIPASLALLPNLTTLSLSGNRLTGPIPKLLGRANLLALHVSHNKIIGDASFLFEKENKAVIDIDVSDNLLKFDFSNVDLGRNLVGFNISHNMIYGSLPTRFGLLTVDFVDVSYNQLCGPIPNGRRFKQVDPKIFSDNKCLCGGPLRACK